MEKDLTHIKDLKFDKKNARKHNERNIAMIETSLKEVGAARSIVIDEDNNILAGNGTVEAAGNAGIENLKIVETTGNEIVAVRRVGLTDEQKKKLALYDNRTAELAEWNAEVLEELEKEIDLSDIFSEKELKEIKDALNELQEVTEDETPEVPTEAKTKRGDIYELGGHRVMCGDSTNADDVAKLMNGQKAELLFTSPPYSDMRTYNGNKDLSIKNLVEFIPTFLEYAKYQAINLGIQRKDHEIFEYWNDYILKARECGYLFLSWNIWAKPSAGSIGNQCAFIPICHEWIFVFGKEFKNINRTYERKTEITKKTKQRRRQKDGSFQYSSFGFEGRLKEMESVFYSNAELGIIRQLHPATFPIELPAEYIKAMTNENDFVVDSFLGSGTTLIACEQLKRKCYGMELDEKYCDVIVSRYCNFTKNNKIKLNGEEIIWGVT